MREVFTCAECDFSALEEWELRLHESQSGHTRHGGWSNLWMGEIFHLPHLRGGKRVLAVIGLIIFAIIVTAVYLNSWAYRTFRQLTVLTNKVSAGAEVRSTPPSGSPSAPTIRIPLSLRYPLPRLQLLQRRHHQHLM